MNEASGTTLFDSSSFIDGSTGTGLTRGVAGSLLGDSDTATTFDGTANGTASTPTAVQGPNVFTVEAWFKTTTTAGGKIIGFGAGSTGNSGSYDRHVYMDNTGKVYFGVYTGSTQTINSTKSYNDGQWHQVVASMGPSGMALYVDDALAGTRPISPLVRRTRDSGGSVGTISTVGPPSPPATISPEPSTRLPSTPPC